MKLSRKRISMATALFVALAMIQVFLGTGRAEPTAKTASPPTGAAAPVGILTTQGNKPIAVNGASAISGATIVSGATIETPEKVGAMINIPSRAVLAISPNTKLTLKFAENGEPKVTVISGCAVLQQQNGTTQPQGTRCGRLPPPRAGGLSPGALWGLIAGVGAAAAGLILSQTVKSEITIVRNPSPSTP